MLLDRREFIVAVAGAAAAARRGFGPPAALRFTAVGQSLILRDLASQQVPGLAAVKAKLNGADVVFSNFEAAVGQPKPPPGPTDPLPSAVIADERVLDSLRDLLNGADANLSEGMPLVWIARGRGLSQRRDRVDGPDLMVATIDRGRAHGLRDYL